MIISPRDSNGFFSNPTRFRATLFYGQDEGAVRENHKNLLSKLTPNPDDPFASVEISQEKIISEPSILYQALSAMSLMGEGQIVIIRHATDKITSIIKQSLEMDECQNKMIITADSLAKKSSLRKLFETNKQTATLASYIDDKSSLERIIRAKLNENNIKYQPDTLAFMVESLGNDRAVTLSEIEKILVYLGDDKQLTLDVVEKLTNQNNSNEIDELCLNIADGKVAEVNKKAILNINNDSEPIVLIRSISRYFQRLLLAKGFMLNGDNPSVAMKKIYPPIFYKQQNSFANHLQKFSPNQLITILSQINKTEKNIKSHTNQEAIFLRNLMSISQKCRKPA